MPNYICLVIEKHRAAALVTVAWAACFTFLFFVAVYMCDGNLVYTLDDPYIHLSVAENILRGGYGVNYEEFSTPSSSVLYPFILAPLLFLGFGAHSPLLVNFLGTGATVWLLVRYLFEQTAGQERRPFSYLIAFLLVIGINAYALPLTGMEHSLHVLTVVAAFCGLSELLSSGHLSSSLLVAVTTMPFLRFEGTALSLASVGVIFACGRRRAAASILAALFFGFYLWRVFTRHMGVPFFPSSVSLKSAFAINAQAGDGWETIGSSLDHFQFSANDRQGVSLILFVGLLLMATRAEGSFTSLKERPKTLMGAVVIFALLAHVFAGNYGQFYRYEVYAFAILLLWGLYVFRETAVELQNLSNPLASVGFVLVILTLGVPFLDATVLTPLASRAIYDQQFQMHRFATEFFPRRVAVNDLGLASFRNDNYVLDLFGLGSEVVREAKTSGTFGKSFIASISKQKDIDFAMIYDKWYKRITPDQWCLMATLKTDVITAGSGQVSFYALKDSVVKEMSDALNRFRETLPERAALRSSDAPCART